ncbi:MAG: acid-resistance rane protein [Marmoricola sp.]|nr:acid-resistance rane protein [Marmoricola sp.]
MSQSSTLEVQPTSPLPPAAVAAAAIAAVVLGAAVLAWTGVTVVVVATLFGFHLVMLAGIQLAVASRGRLPTGVRVLVGVMGSYLLVIGLICLFSPFTSIRLLAVLTAIGWIADAVGSLAAGRRQHGRARTGLISSASLSLLGALALLAWPGLSLVVLVRLGGWLLIIFGIAELVRMALLRNPALQGTA